MVKYLLDTCILVSILRGDTDIQGRVESVGVQNCAISELTLAELFAGPYAILSRTEVQDKVDNANRQIESLRVLSTLIKVLLWQNASEEFARTHALLAREGNPIEDFDLLIGSFAVANGYTLVTGNEKHFCRIPSLKIENWYK